MTHAAFVLVPQPPVRERIVAGLSLLGRATRVADASIRGRAELLVRDDAERELARREGQGERVRSVADSLASRPSDPVLILFGDVVVDRRVVEAIVAESIGPNEVITAETDVGPSHVFLLGPGALASLTVDDLGNLETFEQWTSRRVVRVLRPKFDSTTFAHVVLDRATEQSAIHALFQACIKPIDGIVSRNINRKFSIPLSRVLANTSVTPNQVTIVCLVIAIVAALVALRGDGISLAIAGLLFQVNSVLDGVDGELARVKWAFSKLGEFLDSIGDDLSNFSYFGALVYVASTHDQLLLAWAGGIGLVFWALYLVFLYVSLRGTNRGDVMVVSQQAMNSSAGFWQRAIEVARLLFRRDGFVFLAFLLAIIGRATYILPVVLFGGVSTFVFAVRETLRRAATA